MQDNNVIAEQEIKEDKLDYTFYNIKVKPETLNFIKSMEERYPIMTTEFKRICITNYILFLKKQHDYGPMNITMNTGLKTPEDKKLSLTGLVVRINDKISRLINLVLKNKDNMNESIYDSFLDLSVYGVIAMIVNNDKWGK